MPVKFVYRPRTEVVGTIVEVQCNVCGESETVPPDTLKSMPDDMQIIRLSGGWGDKFPCDLETITFVVHGKCLEMWCNTFKVPVESRHTMGSVPPIPCTHSETGDAMVMQWGWLRKASEEYFDPKIEDTDNLPFSDLIPNPGIYEHFKGWLYEVIDHGWDVNEPHEACVVYRALYGDSKVYARPVRMWAEQVDRDGYSGPRFKLMGERSLGLPELVVDGCTSHLVHTLFGASHDK